MTTTHCDLLQYFRKKAAGDAKAPGRFQVSGLEVPLESLPSRAQAKVDACLGSLREALHK
jgi:hypothetical protein